MKMEDYASVKRKKKKHNVEEIVEQSSNSFRNKTIRKVFSSVFISDCLTILSFLRNRV